MSSLEVRSDVREDTARMLPEDYFSFIKRLMEFLRIFDRIRKIELEIQTLKGQQLDTDHPRE